MPLDKNIIQGYRSDIANADPRSASTQQLIADYYGYLANNGDSSYAGIAKNMAANEGYAANYANTYFEVAVEDYLRSTGAITGSTTQAQKTEMLDEVADEFRQKLAMDDAQQRIDELGDSGDGVLQSNEVSQMHYDNFGQDSGDPINLSGVGNITIPKEAWAGAGVSEFGEAGDWMKTLQDNITAGEKVATVLPLIKDWFDAARQGETSNGVSAQKTVENAIKTLGLLLGITGDNDTANTMMQGFRKAYQDALQDNADLGDFLTAAGDAVDNFFAGLGNPTVTLGDALLALLDRAGTRIPLPSYVDPLILDLDGDGLELYGLYNSQAYFDLDDDMYAELVGWAKPDDGLLVRDLNSNGIIDDINELFGSMSVDGFTELAGLDSNSDGVITSSDTAFSTIQVWKDANGDGTTDAANDNYILTQLAA